MNPHAANPIVSLHAATLRVRDRFILEETTWEIRAGEHWAVLGPNGAGKSTLARALSGETPVVRGRIDPPSPATLRGQAAVVSFERQRGMLARDEQADEQRHFSGDLDGGARVRDYLRPPPAGGRRRPAPPLRLGVEPLLDRRIRELSTGEMRRFQIVLALAAAPRLLILDEPFEGLDAASRSELAVLVEGLMDSERSVVIVTHRLSEIPSRVTHLMGVRDGRVVFQGRRDEPAVQAGLDAWKAQMGAIARPLPLPPPGAAPPSSGEPLVELRDVTVAHRGRLLFANLSWTVRPLEHWALCGPNGSGKTTLLRLIAGDHPQAHANHVRVFGRGRRDAALRELRAGIGAVSPELQVRYRKPLSALDVVISGWYDSTTAAQAAGARHWLESLGVDHLAATPFPHLSQGEQRMVLLARAMIKPPRLLILDEPCQGLDRSNRRRILATVDRIAASGLTTVLYVTHHADEMPACIRYRLDLPVAGR
ncbi:MAG: ATP-binding cassette domain-containing protein [Desulfobacterales bacterium]|nr:ATP-binding cassette domain-containing protein [Desulfobacterales bacterium]MCU0603335.1 ATP-binding cassette domain-containing protein [Desulfobacterales bacterium]